MQKAVERNPADENLWHYKAFLHYHRLPQEQYLMDQFRKETGQDAWEVAALTMEKAITIAQDKGRENTKPPGDGMLQDSYFKWAFTVLRRGEYARGRQLLQQGHDTYFRLMERAAITDMNRHNNQAFLDLIPVFQLEEAYAAAAQGAAEKEGLERKLHAAYLALELKYVHIQPIEQRIIGLSGRPLAGAFDLARRGRHDGARQEKEPWASDLRSMTASRAARRSSGSTSGPFGHRAAALEAEAGEFEGALKKYDELLANYRYTFLDNPQPARAPRRGVAKPLKGGENVA